MQTYLFYDIETSGLNKSFDQVLHFAAIRTDDALNEIARYEIKIKLNPDVIPAPDAMITHRMSLADIAAGVSEYDAIKQIHKWMNEPGTISIGYNTLGFDDEFLRFSFYRNLLAPYTHQYANQCRRFDIYPMTVMYYLYKPDVLTWPERENKVSLKLEDLNRANKWHVGRAHHAMVDVEVTLALAKQLYQERAMWDYLTGYFDKRTDQDRLMRLSSDCGLMVSGKFGTEACFQNQVLSLGTHYQLSNQLIWLRLDCTSFADADKEALLDRRLSIRKKLGEPAFVLPLIDRFAKHLTPERLALARANMQWLQDHPDMLQILSDHHRRYMYPEYKEADANAYLYLNGFWAPVEEDACQRFHLINAEEKANLQANLHHPLLATLALRILGRHFPHALSPEQNAKFTAYMDQISHDAALVDFRGDVKNTLSASYQRIAELKADATLDEMQQQLLIELEDNLKSRFSNVAWKSAQSA